MSHASSCGDPRSAKPGCPMSARAADSLFELGYIKAESDEPDDGED